ncbi:hypothetical protein [Phenylobacterium sp.]|uniref:hypothetical protein n=1 Tax=Phenylobacterium sp. TaxID=1871053 RepID=UPI002DE95416|nr:hypothetical protein [Phenylobacterium sp.]
MPLYTFYPCRPDGSSVTFETVELEDDGQAFIHCLDILDQHLSASHVVAWCAERRVTARHRAHADLAAVIPRPATPEPAKL